MSTEYLYMRGSDVKEMINCHSEFAIVSKCIEEEEGEGKKLLYEEDGKQCEEEVD